MKAAWSSPTTRIAAAEAETHDPGTGPDRYRRAMDWLKEEGHAVALAAFTFDPDEPRSVVVAPTRSSGSPVAAAVPAAQVCDDGRQAWEDGFDRAMLQLEAGTVEKVVLARRVEYAFESEVAPDTIWHRLVDSGAGTYRFLVDGLVGASPELLARVEGDRVESLALAGTAPERKDLAGDLIESEHRYAADSVASALRGLTTDLTRERGTHAFGDLTHVGTRFHGTLHPGATIAEVLAALHPTAAVGGFPPEVAMGMIRENEAARGRYSGPVGWFDAHGNGEFALALRCGQIDGDRVVLHAGGGLVRGSDRDSEWEETELKLRPMRRALGLES